MIGVFRPVLRRVFAVIGSQADIGGRAVGGESVVQVERRLIAGEGIAKAQLRIETVERHAAAPARIKRLRVNHAVTGAQNSLVVELICKPDAGCKSAIEYLFGVTNSGACCSPVISGIDNAARTISGSGVRNESEKRKLVAGFKSGRKPVPSQTIV